MRIDNEEIIWNMVCLWQSHGENCGELYLIEETARQLNVELYEGFYDEEPCIAVNDQILYLMNVED